MSLIVALVTIAVVSFFIIKRIDDLESRLRHLEEGRPVAPRPTASAAAAVQPTATPTPQYRTPVAPLSNDYPQGEPGFDVFSWLAQDFLVKLGAFLLLLAFGWFVSYAFMNDWIGPAGRIALGLLAGSAFLAVGVWRIEQYRHQGGIFTVLGSATVLLTVFAAREIYDFFTPATALAIMFLSVVFVTFVAVRYQSQALALSGLVLGAIAPFFTNADPNVVSLFSYALVLVLGSLWVQRWLGAVGLSIAAFLIVVAYGLPYLIGLSANDQTMALLFAFVFTMIFFVSNTISILLRPDADARYVQTLLAAGTGLYLIAWVYAAADPVWHSLLFVMWMLVFAVGAFTVYLRTGHVAPFYIYGAISIGLLAAATAAELSGPFLTIAYCVQILALMAVTTLYVREKEVVSKIAWLFAGPILLSFGHIASRSWSDGFLHADFFALITLLFTLLAAGQIIIELRAPEEANKNDDATALLIAAAVYGVVIVWLTTHSIFSDGVATTVSLFVYTIAGLIAYFHGRNIGRDIISQCGVVMLTLVVARLLLVDVWSMELVGKIITFFGVGILLISTAFIRRRQID